MGQDAEWFYSQSIYDWGKWLQKIITDQKKRQEDRELQIELTRSLMALTANLHRDPDKTPPYEGRHFYKLSYDEIVEETKTVTGKEMMDFLTERFKDKPIRKRG